MAAVDTKISKFVQRCIRNTIFFYEWLIIKTCRVRICGEIDRSGSIVGFWHGDSFLMNLVMHHMDQEQIHPQVIVTADERGDVITAMVERHHGKTIRVKDGLGMRGTYDTILRAAKTPGEIIAIAADGPLGPYKEPKKLGLSLAMKADKPYGMIYIQGRGIWRSHKRWDHYGIPLPFARIQVACHSFGHITRNNIDGVREEIVWADK